MGDLDRWNNIGCRGKLLLYWRLPNGKFMIESVGTIVQLLTDGETEITGDEVKVEPFLQEFIAKGIKRAEEFKETLHAELVSSAQKDKDKSTEAEKENEKVLAMNNDETVVIQEDKSMDAKRKSFFDNEEKTDNSMFDWCEEHPENGVQFMLEWGWVDENNERVSPYDEPFDSERLIRWRDKEGHEWLESCANRTKFKSICPYCNKGRDECKKGQFQV